MLRVGLVVEAGAGMARIGDLLHFARDAGGYRYAALVVVAGAPAGTGPLSRLAGGAVGALDRFLLRGSRIARRYAARPGGGEGLARLDVRARPAAGRLDLAADDLARIADLGLDLLVWTCPGEPAPAVGRAARLGVLAVRYGDRDGRRHGPPGFWEALHREGSAGFLLRHTGGPAGRDATVLAGSVATSFSAAFNAVAVRQRAYAFLHRVLEAAGRTGELPGGPADSAPLPPYRSPGWADQLRYLFARLAPAVARKALQRYLVDSRWQWVVAFQLGADWRGFDPKRCVVLPNPPGHFLADPFVWRRDGRSFCFLEDYDRAARRGFVAAYELHADGFSPVGPVLSEPFHLSFPFLFEWNGDLFMCPETHEANEIRLYRCERFPDRWTHHRTLMSGVRAVDTVLFPHGSKWWMLTNLDSSGLDDYGSELHVFYSDSPDSGEWMPHRGNPVILDSTRGRNGGLIVEDNRVFRVHQVQGYGTYGEDAGVAEIAVLTEDDYCETPLFRIAEGLGDEVRATHSLAFRDGILALDLVIYERPTT